jgi:hypothetical protein
VGVDQEAVVEGQFKYLAWAGVGGEELSNRGVKVWYLLARAVSDLACKSGHSLCFHLDGSCDSLDYAENMQRRKQHDG